MRGTARSPACVVRGPSARWLAFEDLTMAPTSRSRGAEYHSENHREPAPHNPTDQRTARGLSDASAAEAGFREQVVRHHAAALPRGACTSAAMLTHSEPRRHRASASSGRSVCEGGIARAPHAAGESSECLHRLMHSKRYSEASGAPTQFELLNVHPSRSCHRRTGQVIHSNESKAGHSVSLLVNQRRELDRACPIDIARYADSRVLEEVP